MSTQQVSNIQKNFNTTDNIQSSSAGLKNKSISEDNPSLKATNSDIKLRPTTVSTAVPCHRIHKSEVHPIMKRSSSSMTQIATPKSIPNNINELFSSTLVPIVSKDKIYNAKVKKLIREAQWSLRANQALHNNLIEK